MTPVLRLVVVVLLGALALAGQEPPTADYDAANRIWTLANEQIEVQFRLNQDNAFRLLTLRRLNGKQWVSDGQPAASPIYLTIDDLTLDQDAPWQLVTTRVEAAGHGGRRHMIQLRHDEARAEIVLRAEIYPRQPFLRTYYTYRNLDRERHFLEEARFLNLRFNTERRRLRAFYVNQVRQSTPLMFDTFERDLARQPARQVTLWAGAHADQCTWLALRDSADNGLVFGWEFDGRASLSARLSGPEALDVFGGPLDLHAPVAAGRQISVPAGFLGLYEGDWDEAAYRTHRYVESVLAAPLPDDNFPYLMFNTWGYRENIDEATLRRAAQIAAQVGVELFVVDLGWARHIGEWTEDLSRFPGRLRAFADYVHSLGMKFGLHFVPVEVSAHSQVLAGNPDWASSRNDWYAFDDAVSVCLGHAPVQAWVREALRQVVEDYAVDWVTQDGENLVKTCTKTTHTHDPENSNWANSVNGIDALVRSTRLQYPQVFWENNGDGGTMLTFEAVKNYATFGSCDACDHFHRRQAVWGMSYVFPPRFISRYMEEPPIKFTTRSSMFGGPWILMQPVTRWTPAEIDLARREAELYKSLRGLIREGKVYHLLERPTGYSIEAIESFHPEWDRGVIFVYRPDSPVTAQTIFPRGLRPEGTYNVRFQESSNSWLARGSDLMTHGINVKLPAKLFAEIVYIVGVDRAASADETVGASENTPTANRPL